MVSHGRQTRHLLASLGVVFVLLVTPALAGCASAPQAASAQAPAKSALPSFLDDSPTTVREAYADAAAHPETLTQVPCFCGCDAVGHRNVRDCFVKEVKADGTVVWDKMAYG